MHFPQSANVVLIAKITVAIVSDLSFLRLLFIVQPATRINQLVFIEYSLEKVCSNVFSVELSAEFHQRN